MKKLPVIFLIFFIGFNVQSQKKSYKKIWEALILNNRKEAVAMADKIRYDKADIEGLVLKMLTKVENGGFVEDANFVKALTKRKDFEYYMYALMNESYVFGDPKSLDFNKYIKEREKYCYRQNFNLPVMRDIIDYRNYETAKLLKEPDYEKYTANINTVKDWQFCGPFENLNKSGLNTVYPPEKEAFSKTGYNANSNGILNWYPAPFDKGDPFMLITNHSEYGEGINYAQTFIENEKARDILIHLGIGQATKVWLDDVLIFEQDENRKSEMGAYTIKVHLPAGNNRILVKTTNVTITYFILKLTGTDNKPLNNIKITSHYKPYVKIRKDEINPVQLPNIFEVYFEQKVKEHPDDYFYNYCLFKTYLRNEKEKNAGEIIDKFTGKFPASSWIKVNLIIVKNLEENDDKILELQKNIENNDKTYYWTLLQKLTDVGKLIKKDLDEFNKELKLIKNTISIPNIPPTCDLLSALRQQDQEKMKKAAKELIKVGEELESTQLIDTYLTLYNSIFYEDDFVIKKYEEAYKKYYDFSIAHSLCDLYDKKGEHDKSIQIYKYLANGIIFTKLFTYLVDELIDLQRYEEAMKYVDKALELYPYSFTFMKHKGFLFQQLGKKKEALKWYKKSLSHNSADFELRKIINDLEKIENPLKKVLLKDPYKYIKDNRGKITENNHGYNILFDDYNILLYNEGAHTNHSTMIYEITSEEGVENLKEYNMNLYGDYEIVKSEIVKPDGTIVPAERSGSNLVFNSLSPGDVILVEYEINYTSTGRFYKDLTKDYRFDSYSPSLACNFRVIAPKSKKIHSAVTGGKIKSNKKNSGKYTIYHWKDKMLKALPPSENFMPPTIDVARVVHVSTINSWDDIARWYADLSRSSIKYDKTVNETFDKIFPDGYQNLPEYERAKKIYDYMAANLTYSYVDFKQSGFIPQKPSKTINSKLGDCKDFSTLFLALGRKAGLQVNLVLVNTSDNGVFSDVLPAINFNHSIVKVKINGKEHYIELTDKDLPFNSEITGLYNANALEIPYKEGEPVNKGLLHIKQKNAIPSEYQSDIVYTIYPDRQEIDVTLSGKGARASAIHSLLNQKSEAKIKKDILRKFENMDNLDLDLISYKIIDNDRTHPVAKFKAKFKVLNKLQKLGKSYIFKLPLLLQSYTQNLISTEERHYPIRYTKYEDTRLYASHYIIELKNGKKFNEIPENLDLTYKKHHFTAVYKKLSDSKLQVEVKAQIPFDDIQPSEYPAFKKYVKQVLEVFDSLMSF